MYFSELMETSVVAYIESQSIQIYPIKKAKHDKIPAEYQKYVAGIIKKLGGQQTQV